MSMDIYVIIKVDIYIVFINQRGAEKWRFTIRQVQKLCAIGMLKVINVSMCKI